MLTNSILVQRYGEWYIYNKIQLESGVGLPEITFDEGVTRCYTEHSTRSIERRSL